MILNIVSGVTVYGIINNFVLKAFFLTFNTHYCFWSAGRRLICPHHPLISKLSDLSRPRQATVVLQEVLYCREDLSDIVRGPGP